MSADSSQVDLTGNQTTAAGSGEEENPQETLVDDAEVEPPEPSDGHADGSDESESSEEQSGDDTDSLTEWGIEEDHRPRKTRRDQPDGDLRQDARVNDGSDSEPGQQEKLFPDVDDNQQTLTGAPAATQCLFEE